MVENGKEVEKKSLKTFINAFSHITYNLRVYKTVSYSHIYKTLTNDPVCITIRFYSVK